MPGAGRPRTVTHADSVQLVAAPRPQRAAKAPAAPGLDVLVRGLTLTSESDHDTLAITDRLFDGLYEHTRRQLMTGRPPA